MTTQDKIDGVLIDSDESGFRLILSGEKGEYELALDAEAAQDLHAAVALEITPWLLEMSAARRTWRPGLEGGDDIDPHPGPVTDPEHPDHHDVMSEVWDSREEK